MSAILQFIREHHILAIIEQTVALKKSSLNLNEFEITEIPELLFTCSQIKQLYLHRNSITSVPAQILELKNLHALTLDYNNITSLPPEFGKLKNLVNLNISCNPLYELIPEIGELVNLEALWCNKIGLCEVPKEIAKLTKLDTFGARGNELTYLPDEFTKLSKLRWLTLENNKIEKLPDSMNRLKSLVHLNIKNNNIVTFPMSLLKNTRVMFCLFNNNNIAYLPEDLDLSSMASLELLDMRRNPVCVLTRPIQARIRYEDNPHDYVPSAPATQALVYNANTLRLPAVPVAIPPDQMAARPPVELDLSSDEDSSEDWENSVNSSDIDVWNHSDDDEPENEIMGMVLPELSKYAATAS